MFIEKYADRVNGFLGKCFRKSRTLSIVCLVAIILAAAAAGIWLLMFSGSIDSFIADTAAALLWALLLAGGYFLGWIVLENKSKDEPKQQRFYRWFMLFFAIGLLVAFCTLLCMLLGVLR